MMRLKPSTIKDCYQYVYGVSASFSFSPEDCDDIAAETILRLIQRDDVDDDNAFYWARVLSTDVSQDVMSWRSAVSGMRGFSYKMARRYLQQNDMDVERAYANQSTTVRVGRALLNAALAPSNNIVIKEHEVSKSVEDVPLSHDMREALKLLTHDERRVLELVSGVTFRIMSVSSAAAELNMSREEAQRLLNSARRKMRQQLT